MTTQEQIKLIATITSENSRQIRILVKTCVSLVENAAPFLQQQPELQEQIAIQQSDLEHLLSDAVKLMRSLEELSGEFDLQSPDD